MPRTWIGVPLRVQIEREKKQSDDGQSGKECRNSGPFELDETNALTPGLNRKLDFREGATTALGQSMAFKKHCLRGLAHEINDLPAYKVIFFRVMQAIFRVNHPTLRECNRDCSSRCQAHEKISDGRES